MKRMKRKLNFKRILGVLSAFALVTATATSISAVYPDQPKDSKWEYLGYDAEVYMESLNELHPLDYPSDKEILENTHRLNAWYEMDIVIDNTGEYTFSDGNLDTFNLMIALEKTNKLLEIWSAAEKEVGIPYHIDINGSFTNKKNHFINEDNWGETHSFYPANENSVMTEKQVKDYYSALQENTDGITVQNLEYMLSCDIDNTDTLNINDVVTYFRFIRTNYDLSEESFVCADSNQDGKVNVVDTLDCINKILV